MKKKIQGIHLEITDALKDKINKEIEEIQSKHFSNININVDLSVDKLEHICHIILVTDTKEFNVTKKDEDMYKSIDDSFKVLKNSLSKYKDKQICKKRHGESLRNIEKQKILKEEELLKEELLDLED